MGGWGFLEDSFFEQDVVDVCFETEAALLQQIYDSVSHVRLQLVKDIPMPQPGQSSMAGTQAIDSTWDYLDKYTNGLNVSTKFDKRAAINPLIWVYMYSWQWRLNMYRCNKDLWQAFGDLCKSL